MNNFMDTFLNKTKSDEKQYEAYYLIRINAALIINDILDININYEPYSTLRNKILQNCTMHTIKDIVTNYSLTDLYNSLSNDEQKNFLDEAFDFAQKSVPLYYKNKQNQKELELRRLQEQINILNNEIIECKNQKHYEESKLEYLQQEKTQKIKEK